MKKWLARLFWRWVWGKPKKTAKDLRNPKPKTYGPKPRKIKKY
jgi:hypothetical protein